jgi:hypothetical protein
MVTGRRHTCYLNSSISSLPNCVFTTKNKLYLHTIQTKYHSTCNFDTKPHGHIKLKYKYMAVLQPSVPMRQAFNKTYATYMVILGNVSAVHITGPSVRLPSRDRKVRTPTDICITREYNTNPPRAPLSVRPSCTISSQISYETKERRAKPTRAPVQKTSPLPVVLILEAIRLTSETFVLLTSRHT